MADRADGQTSSDPDRDRLLAELYRSESGGLMRLVARRTGNPDDAEDIVQDAFHRLARLSGALPAWVERPQAYVRRVAVNLLKDRAKQSARRSSALHIVADEDVLAAPDQQRLLEFRDLLRRLEGAMTHLRPRTREIFMAHRVEGLTYAEIAQRTGLSIKGVEKQMSKALRQLDALVHGR